MPEDLPIPGEVLSALGPGTLLALVVLLIITGRLVPKRTHDAIVNALKAERDQWRTVALTALGHTEQLLPAAQVAASMVQSLAIATGVHADRPSVVADVESAVAPNQGAR